MHAPSFVVSGDSAGDWFGRSVSGAGDVNNDGFDDFIVGAPHDGNDGVNSGIARVFSGADAAILYTLASDVDGDRFGWCVSGAGDVNNDGFDDFIVTAHTDDTNGFDSGSARVFSGADGSILYIFFGDSAEDYFGRSASGAGDINNDGFSDIIVGANSNDENGDGSGMARVFSGADGSVLYTFNGDSAVDSFGFSVSGAGDVNGDGFDDLIVGAIGDDNNGPESGSARVFSGSDGSILYTFNGDSAYDTFGISVSGAGDVNNDGFDDLIVGAYLDDPNGNASGSARVLSGADGSILYTFHGDQIGDNLGTSVSGAGDVDGDGFDDLIVGAPIARPNGFAGIARVYSGVDGSTLYTFDGDSANDRFGFWVSGAGDLNNDGYADLVVGALFDDENGADSGSAIVIMSDVPSTPCPGDTNGDDVVNFTDLNAVLADFGLAGMGLPGDVDGSGQVDFTDLNEALSNFGIACPE